MNATDDLIAAIVEEIDRTGGLTLGEIRTIADAAGMTVDGDLVLGLADWNVWFYVGVSAGFVDLIEKLRALTEPRTLSVLDVIASGDQLLSLPLVRQPCRRYKHPHWLPMQLCPVTRVSARVSACQTIEATG